jgi:predicted O-methyltransferase YrrM
MNQLSGLEVTSRGNSFEGNAELPNEENISSRILSPVSRTCRYARAQVTLANLKRRTAGMVGQSQELVRETFTFCDGFLSPAQMAEELQRLATDVRELKPRRVLEIGTAKGGTLYLWTRLAAPDATILSVDLPSGKGGGGYSLQRAAIYRRFASSGQKVHLLRVDSHAPETRDRVIELFAGEPVDFLFIDGDHSYEGAKQDWDMYASLVRPGGLVAFHDISMNFAELHQVKHLWDEIKPSHEHWEYAFHGKGIYGIGVIRK